MSAPNNGNYLCAHARPHYRDFVSPERRHLVPDFIIKHIEGCDACRQKVELLQQAFSQQQKRTIDKYLQLHFLYAGKPVTCQDVKPFMPALLNLRAALPTPTPITVHIDSCPQCQNDLEKIRMLNLGGRELSQLGRFLADMSVEGVLGRPCEEEVAVTYWNGSQVHVLQQLRDTIREVVERPDSGVVTVYPPAQPGDAADSQMPTDEAEAEEAEEKEQPPDTKEPVCLAGLKEKMRRIHFRSLLKPALVIAIIIVASAMFFYYYTSIAMAASLKQVCQAVEEVKNVYIARFNPMKKEPIQEEWVSLELNIRVAKTGDSMVFHDLNSRLIKEKILTTGVIERYPLDKIDMAEFEKFLNSHFGMVPFDSSKNLPAGAIWENVTQQYPELAAENVEIYDLLWQTKMPDTLIRWSYFVDIKTSRPLKLESYRKISQDDEYNLQNMMIVAYPEAAEIKAVLQAEDLLSDLSGTPQR